MKYMVQWFITYEYTQQNTQIRHVWALSGSSYFRVSVYNSAPPLRFPHSLVCVEQRLLSHDHQIALINLCLFNLCNFIKNIKNQIEWTGSAGCAGDVSTNNNIISITIDDWLHVCGMFDCVWWTGLCCKQGRAHPHSACCTVSMPSRRCLLYICIPCGWPKQNGSIRIK